MDMKIPNWHGNASFAGNGYIVSVNSKSKAELLQCMRTWTRTQSVSVPILDLPLYSHVILGKLCIHMCFRLLVFKSKTLIEFENKD